MSVLHSMECNMKPHMTLKWLFKITKFLFWIYLWDADYQAGIGDVHLLRVTIVTVLYETRVHNATIHVSPVKNVIGSISQTIHASLASGWISKICKPSSGQSMRQLCHLEHLSVYSVLLIFKWTHPWGIVQTSLWRKKNVWSFN